MSGKKDGTARLQETDTALSPADAALIKACHDADFERVRQAVENGADVNLESAENDNFTPIMMLFENDLDETRKDFRREIDKILKIAQYLLDHGADINHVAKKKIALYDGKKKPAGEFEEERWSAVFYCTLFAPLEIMRFVFAHGADPNLIDSNRETALDQVEFDLLTCDSNEADRGEARPCEMAIRRNVLLEHGALRSSTLQTLERMETLSVAERCFLLGCWHWDISLLQKAWDQGFDFSVQSRWRVFDETIALGFVFEWKNYHGNLELLEDQLIEVIAFLLAHGVSVNAENGAALYHAVREGLLKTVKFLLQAGAVPQSCNCGWIQLADEPRHHYTLLEKVRCWRLLWNETTGRLLTAMISDATEKWNEHPRRF